MNCRNVIRELSSYLEGDLDVTVLAELEVHLARCEDCRIVVESLRKTITLYQTSAGHTQVPEEVRQHLFQRLHLDEFMKTESPLD